MQRAVVYLAVVGDPPVESGGQPRSDVIVQEGRAEIQEAEMAEAVERVVHELRDEAFPLVFRHRLVEFALTVELEHVLARREASTQRIVAERPRLSARRRHSGTRVVVQPSTYSGRD